MLPVMDDDQWKTLGADVCLYTKQILIASKDQQTPNPLAPLIVIPLIVTTVVGFDLDRTVVGGGGVPYATQVPRSLYLFT